MKWDSLLYTIENHRFTLHDHQRVSAQSLTNGLCIVDWCCLGDEVGMIVLLCCFTLPTRHLMWIAVLLKTVDLMLPRSHIMSSFSNGDICDWLWISPEVIQQLTNGCYFFISDSPNILSVCHLSVLPPSRHNDHGHSCAMLCTCLQRVLNIDAQWPQLVPGLIAHSVGVKW